MLVILGPTASGKTALAARLAHELNGEVISADSRQVYRGMDLGTGKDYDDYIVEGVTVPVHLVDIADPGYEYNIYEFREDFKKAYADIVQRGKLPVLCGGSGMYLDAVLRNYEMAEMPEEPGLISELEKKPDDELVRILKSLRLTHNTTDLLDRNRTIRAIMIARHPQKKEHKTIVPGIEFIIIGIRYERENLRQRITSRLQQRLDSGLVREVSGLLEKGVTADQLKFYGLEYRYITAYLEKEISYDTMFRLLNTAIHQFAKRQMTWFRRMEKNGLPIHWIDGLSEMEEKMQIILSLISRLGRT